MRKYQVPFYKIAKLKFELQNEHGIESIKNFRIKIVWDYEWNSQTITNHRKLTSIP